MLLPLLVLLAMPLATPTPEPDALPPPGLNTPTTAALQLLTGTAACCAVGTLLNVPLLGPVVAVVVGGVVVAGAETVVGDAVGQTRSALVWPVVTSTGIFVAGGVASLALTIAASTSPWPRPELFGAVVAMPFVAGALGVAVPVLAYHLTAIPKAHDDVGGFGVPGILVPADPSNSRDPPATTPAVPPARPITVVY